MKSLLQSVVIKAPKRILAFCFLCLFVTRSFADPIQRDVNFSDLTFLDDISGNQVAEVATLVRNEFSEDAVVHLHDSHSGEELGRIEFLSSSWRVLGMLAIDGDPDNPAIGVFGIRRRDQLPIVQIKDAKTGALIRNLFPLSTRWSIVAANSVKIDQLADGPAMAVLARRRSDGLMIVQIRDVTTNVLVRNIVPLGLGWTPKDMEIVEVNGVKAAAVLAVRDTDGLTIVQIRRLTDGSLVRNVYPLGLGWTARDFSAFSDVNENEAGEIAVRMTRNTDDLEIIQIRDSLTGDLLSNLYPLPASSGWITKSVHEISGGSEPSIGIFSVRQNDEQMLVQVRGLANEVLRNIYFIGPPWRDEQSMLLVSSSLGAASRIALMANNQSTRARIVQIRDALTGGLTANIRLPDSPALFDDTPIKLADPAVQYSAEACEDPVIQFVIPVSINGDGDKDFIVHYWCELPRDQWGTDVSSETPDLLVAFLSDGLGGYEAANTEVFGEDSPKLGGASRKFATGDMNGDGRPDFAFAMNREDGRNGSSNVVSSVFEKPAILLSSADGTYSVHQVGNPVWGHAVDMADNEDGTKDALFAGFSAGRDNFQAFRFNNNQFASVTNQYPDQAHEHWGNTFRFVSSSGTESQLAIGFDTVAGLSGISLFSKLTGSWIKADSFFLDVVRQQDCTQWNGTNAIIDVLQIGNTEYFFAAIDEIVVSPISLTGREAPIVVGKLSGHVPEGGVLDPNVVCDQNEMPNVNQLFFFEIVNDKLQLIQEEVIDHPNAEINANFYEMRDINKDGLPDLVIQAFSSNFYNRELGGVPDVYVNVYGSFERQDLQEFPGLSNREVPSHGYLTDINQDGFEDLVVFGLNAGEFGDIEIYMANQRIR